MYCTIASSLSRSSYCSSVNLLVCRWWLSVVVIADLSSFCHQAQIERLYQRPYTVLHHWYKKLKTVSIPKNATIIHKRVATCTLMLLCINQFMITGWAKTTEVRITITVFSVSLLATHTEREARSSCGRAMQHPSSVEMGTAGTVIGVLIALGLVILSALVAAYVLWKDGCCKKRREEQRSGDTEGRGRGWERGEERERKREGGGEEGRERDCVWEKEKILEWSLVVDGKSFSVVHKHRLMKK